MEETKPKIIERCMEEKKTLTVVIFDGGRDLKTNKEDEE